MRNHANSQNLFTAKSGGRKIGGTAEESGRRGGTSKKGGGRSQEESRGNGVSKEVGSPCTGKGVA